MANESELDCILFEYRGLKFTFRIKPAEQDSNGEFLSDTYYGDDGVVKSKRYDELIQYGDIIADHLDAERAKGGLLQVAQQAAQAFTPPPPPGVPPMGYGGAPTGYAPPPTADQPCPKCGGGLLPQKHTPRGPVRECAQQRGQCVNDKGYPTSVWLQSGRR